MTSDAHITFDDDEPGAFSISTELYLNGEIRKAHVNVSVDWLENHGTTSDSDSFQTYIHEIGHALGLVIQATTTPWTRTTIFLPTQPTPSS